MISIDKKLEKVHVNFLEFHNLASLSKSVYAAILIYKKRKKIWVLYLRFRNDL